MSYVDRLHRISNGEKLTEDDRQLIRYAADALAKAEKIPKAVVRNGRVRHIGGKVTNAIEVKALRDLYRALRAIEELN